LNFKENDLQFAALRGVTHLQLQEQIATFREGTRYANLCAPAIIGNGIHRLSDKEERDLITIFHSKKQTTLQIIQMQVCFLKMQRSFLFTRK